MKLQRYEAQTIFRGLDYDTIQDDEGPFCLSDDVDALEKRVAELEAQAHYANGTCELAIQHRDSAEARVEKLEAQVAEARVLLDDAQASILVLDGPWQRAWNTRMVQWLASTAPKGDGK